MKPVLKTCRSIARRTASPHTTYRKLVQAIPVGTKRTVRTFLESHRLFFIVSTGRTGSAWLSSLLNVDERARVEHEPVLWEQVAHREAIHDASSAQEYVDRFRLKHMYLQWVGHARSGRDTFGEVNSAIRRHVPLLQRVLPHATFIHIVRDGTEFVRSVMSRSTYGGSDPVYASFQPPSVDEYSARWQHLTEFEKTCWVWQWSNRFMRETVGRTVRFEDLLRSYPTFSTQILDATGLRVDEDVWRESVSRPRNTTATYRIGKWNTWTPEQQQTFMEICGREMEAYGYEISALSSQVVADRAER